MRTFIFGLILSLNTFAFAQMEVQPTPPPPAENLPLPDGAGIPAPNPGLESGAPTEETIQSLLQPFNYQADSRRDPFEVFREVKPLTTDFAGPLLPLQRYSLDEVRLVGILWDVKAPKAMFMDPMKNVHFLGKDDRIGRSNGYVAVIREGEVVVVEPANVRGEISFTTRVLRIVR